MYPCQQKEDGREAGGGGICDSEGLWQLDVYISGRSLSEGILYRAIESPKNDINTSGLVHRRNNAPRPYVQRAQSLNLPQMANTQTVLGANVISRGRTT